jgi:ubiquinone/menaquinone biosynthesis C-methylase UbiE
MIKNKNFWHKEMYDKPLAEMTIGSEHFKQLAKKEASFIINKANIQPGQTLLDVPCGTGRHSVVFATHGIKVTGLDINSDLLKLAKKCARGYDALFEVADMANLRKYKNQFDVATNLFSSFGYFATDAENKKVLMEIHSTLKPNGTFVLHLIDRDWLMAVFEPASWRLEGEVCSIVARKFDPVTNYNESHEIILNQKTGKARHYFHRMRLYSKSEVVRLLKDVGFRKIRVYGDADGSKFVRRRSTHPFYFATK